MEHTAAKAEGLAESTSVRGHDAAASGGGGRVWHDAMVGFSVCSCRVGGGRGVGTRPWWLALLACGGTYWPLTLEPSAMTSRHPYFCGHPHCLRASTCLGGNPECNFCPWRPPRTA